MQLQFSKSTDGNRVPFGDRYSKDIVSLWLLLLSRHAMFGGPRCLIGRNIVCKNSRSLVAGFAQKGGGKHDVKRLNRISRQRSFLEINLNVNGIERRTKDWNTFNVR